MNYIARPMNWWSDLREWCDNQHGEGSRQAKMALRGEIKCRCCQIFQQEKSYTTDDLKRLDPECDACNATPCPF